MIGHSIRQSPPLLTDVFSYQIHQPYILGQDWLYCFDVEFMKEEKVLLREYKKERGGEEECLGIIYQEITKTPEPIHLNSPTNRRKIDLNIPVILTGYRVQYPGIGFRIRVQGSVSGYKVQDPGTRFSIRVQGSVSGYKVQNLQLTIITRSYRTCYSYKSLWFTYRFRIITDYTRFEDLKLLNLPKLYQP